MGTGIGAAVDSKKLAEKMKNCNAALRNLHIENGKYAAAIENFEEEINTHGVGLISAIYDGNPPFQSRGCISKAKNVSEILRAQWLLKGNK